MDGINNFPAYEPITLDTAAVNRQAQAQAQPESSAPALPTAEAVPPTPEQVLADTLMGYGFKVTEENKAMLQLMLENGIPLTKENVQRMNQALKLTQSEDKALFILQNNMKLSQANAAHLDALVSGQFKLNKQLGGLLFAVEQLGDKALVGQLRQIFSAFSVGDGVVRGQGQGEGQATVQGQGEATAQATVQGQGQATAQATMQGQGQATAQATMQGQSQATAQATMQGQGQATAQAQTQVQATAQATMQGQATEQAQTQAQTQATAQATMQGQGETSEQAQTQATTQGQGQTTAQATTQGQATAQATIQAQGQPPAQGQGQTPPPLPQNLTFPLEESTPKTIDRYLNNLRELVAQVKQALANGDEGSAARILQEVRPLENHIDFLAQIREQAFVQLPIFYENTEKLLDLHVFKDGKKSAGNGKKASSALIALDTAELGRFETYVQKNAGGVSCQFRLESDEVVQKVRTNIHKLSTLLMEKGYSLDHFSFVSLAQPYTLLDRPATNSVTVSHFDEKV